LGPPRSECGSAEAFEDPDRQRDAGGLVSKIELSYCVAGLAALIGEVHSDGDAVADPIRRDDGSLP
jgi:hypothetical protein